MKEAAASWVTQGHYILGVYNPKARGWCMPGGKVEPGETIAHAQERELLEETGLVTIEAQHVYSATCSFDPEFLVHVYAVKAEGQARRMEPQHPVCWLPRSWFEASDTFGPFFVKLFAAVKGMP